MSLVRNSSIEPGARLTRGGNVSLLGNIGKALGGAVKGAVGGFLTGGAPGAIAGALGGAGSTLIKTGAGNTVKGLPTVIKGLPTRVTLPGAGTIGAVTGGIAGAIVTSGNGKGQYYVDSNGCTRKRYRKMNYCNPRALNRAARRLSGYMKQHKKVEQALRRSIPQPVRRQVRQSAKRC